MNEYIKRNVIIDYLDSKLDSLEVETMHGFPRTRGSEIAYHGTRDFVQLIPAADVVEVVRCKDCKLYSGKYCTLTDDMEDRREPNDYCSCGERKEVQE